MNETDLEDVVEFDLSSEDKELSDKVGFLIEGVLIPILATLGIVGKSMNACPWIFQYQQMNMDMDYWMQGRLFLASFWLLWNIVMTKSQDFIHLISGNILCVWTFNKKDVELKPSFANLLKCLSIFDTIFLVTK